MLTRGKTWSRVHRKPLDYHYKFSLKKNFINVLCRDFPGSPVVKNLPCNAGDVGSIPGQETKIRHASEKLSLCVTTREPPCCN